MSLAALPAVAGKDDNENPSRQPEQRDAPPILSPSRLRAIEGPAFEVVVAIETNNPKRLQAAYDALASIFAAEIDDAKERKARDREPVMPPAIGARMVLAGLKSPTVRRRGR